MSTEQPTGDWVSPACTLPSQSQPLRVAEFDALFAAALLDVSRISPTRLRFVMDASVEAETQRLAARETQCCSFFTFDFDALGDGRLAVEVTTPTAQIVVLDALSARAQAVRRG